MTDRLGDDLRSILAARLASLDTAQAIAKDRRDQAVKAADDRFRLEIAGLQEERDAVSHLLTIEQRKHGQPGEQGGQPPPLSVGDFFVRVARVNGPQTKEGFRTFALAAGYDIDGRGAHAAVVNCMRGGRLELRDDGLYGVPASRSGELVLEKVETPF